MNEPILSHLQWAATQRGRIITHEWQGWDLIELEAPKDWWGVNSAPDPDIVKLLLERGANPNDVVENTKNTPGTFPQTLFLVVRKSFSGLLSRV